MRLSVTALFAVVCACGPASEAKPIEIVNIPQPPASSKPSSPVVTQKDPGPDAPGTPIATGGPEIRARDARKLVMKPGEAERLGELLENTPRYSPDRPGILRQLGEAEEALARWSAASGGETLGPRARSIQSYATLSADYPQLATRDEALYYLGLEHELADHMKEARSTWYELIKSHPNSKFIPHAYFAFGEVFFRESTADPSKLDLAAQAYGETLKYPKDTNPLFAATLYRIGLVAKRKGDNARAATYFARLDKDFRDSEEAKLPR